MNSQELSGYDLAINELNHGTSESVIDALANDSHPFDRGAQWALGDWQNNTNPAPAPAPAPPSARA